MPATISTASTHDLCNLVKPSFSDLKPISYNRFQPDRTVWWLSPTSANPSYKYAKLCFMLDERDENTMMAGLYVEKGLGKSYCAVYGAAKSKKLAMDDSWGWHNVIGGMQQEKLTKDLQRITDATGTKPLVMISGQYSQVDFDPYAHRLKAETIYYEADEAGLREVDYRPSPDKNPLGSLRGATTLPELADKLRCLPESDFIWIDMAFVLPMRIELASEESLSPDTLSKKVLSHFEGWVNA